MTDYDAWQEKKRRLAVYHLISGGIISIAMLILLTWPGIIGSFLLDTLMLEMPRNFSVEWVFNGILNILIFVAIAPVFMLAPVVGVLSFLLMGLPSIIGAIRLIRNKGGSSWLKFASVFYILMFPPFGTAFAIFTFVRLRRMEVFEKTRVEVESPAIKEVAH